MNTEITDIQAVDSSSTKVLLSVKNLTCERFDLALFSNLSFCLVESQGLRIVGPNGSGKTTLIRTIAGIHKPVFGEIFWNLDQKNDSKPRKTPKIAYVGHTTGLRGELTPLENLEFYARINGNHSNLSPKECLEKMNVAHYSKRLCMNLSAGQRQRVCLSRLALNRYDLWLLDEPATSLDSQGIDLLIDLAKSHVNAGGMYIYCSHQPIDFGSGQDAQLDLCTYKNEFTQC
ncbi:MAG: heme ABC exporter ATP-binding protein CcmA [Gammaproteobacteria bacterium]|nr:heme ABC exporter ATP-binding protein CcmA [Gammaproteobacteria bacterium]